MIPPREIQEIQEAAASLHLTCDTCGRDLLVKVTETYSERDRLVWFSCPLREEGEGEPLSGYHMRFLLPAKDVLWAAENLREESKE